MNVAELGEFPLIQRLAKQVLSTGSSLLVGIGDDAAVYRLRQGGLVVATSDALVEDVHFRRSTTSWRDLGWKALAVSVSDIAAMGAEPRFALVSLGVGADEQVEFLEDLYAGIQELCQTFGVALAGGDVVASPSMFIDVMMVGEGAQPLMLRSNGLPGWELAVTGRLGASAGGLRILTQEAAATDEDARALKLSHNRPWARVREAQVLRAAGVTCAIDLSDGLLGDAARLAESIHAAAVLWLNALPVHPALERRFPRDCRELALAGGEDYELLVAVPPDLLPAVAEQLERDTGTPLRAVGQLVEYAGSGPTVRVLAEPDGQELEFQRRSWEHFKGAEERGKRVKRDE